MIWYFVFWFQDTSSSDEAPSAAHKSSPSKQSIISKHFPSKIKYADSQSSQASDDDFVTTTPSRNASKPSTQSSASDLNRSNEENIAPQDEQDVDEDCMIVEDVVDEGEASTSSADTRPGADSVSKKDKGIQIVIFLALWMEHFLFEKIG